METSHHRHILLVDDEEQVLFVVGESLKKLGAQCKVTTARDGHEALALCKSTSFDLIITDIKMPGMDGIELTEALYTLTPEIPVIWMTGFGNKALREEARRLGVQYFLTKPLNVSDIRQIARQALEVTKHQQGNAVSSSSPHIDDALQKRMRRLKNDTGAYAVLLITAAGTPVETVGASQGLDVATLSALVAGNFLAAHEIAKMLGRESNFKVSYHESDQHNVYAYGIGDNYLLVTVFGNNTRTGVVWFYAQQAASDLKKILDLLDINDSPENTLSHLFTQEVESELNDMLASIWGTPAPEHSATASSSPEPDDHSVQPAQEHQNREANAAPPSSRVTLLSYEEAVAKGLVQDNIADTDNR